MKYTRYTGDGISILLYPTFLDKESSDTLFSYVDALLTPKKTGKRRTNKTYGVEGLVYDINFSGRIVHRKAEDWNLHTPLLEMKELIEAKIKEELNICVAQYYPSGDVGIAPHRDKEMVQGTKICGLSLGEEARTLTMRRGNEKVTIPLPPGSLYVFEPPTNDFWSHSIEINHDVKTPRISLTFRNYKTA